MRTQKLRYYDLLHDEEALRVSGFDDHGSEFWLRMALPVSGKERRLRERAAFAAITEAIQSGLEPGQVIVDLDAMADAIRMTEMTPS